MTHDTSIYRFRGITVQKYLRYIVVVVAYDECQIFELEFLLYLKIVVYFWIVVSLLKTQIKVQPNLFTTKIGNIEKYPSVDIYYIGEIDLNWKFPMYRSVL